MARPNSAPAPAEHLPAEARGLLERGRTLLARVDACELRALLGAVAELSDIQRRMWVLTELIEQELERPAAEGSPSTIMSSRVEARAALAAAALELLEREPCEPELLLRTGRLLDLLGQTEAGGMLAGAARALEPEPAGIGAQLAVARRKLAAEPELGALSARALDIVERARPPDGLSLSLCMIVRDEQEALPRCLASVADFVDEIVILDTGSRDRTPAIARSFGAQVITRQWAGSFACARNASLDAATGEWILFLDADELLVQGEGERLRALTTRSWCEGFQLSVINHTGKLGDGTTVTHSALRMFRNRPEYRFEGRLHEQVAHRLPGYLPGRVRDSGVRIEHYGYLDAVRVQRGKSERNLELLRRQQAEGPSSAFLHFNLGSEHAAAGDHRAAVAELERAWRLLQGQDGGGREFAAALIKRLVGSLRACGRDEEAIALAGDGLAQFPQFTDLIFEQAMASAACGRRQAAIELLERCLRAGEPSGPHPSSAGCGSYLALLELASLQRESGDAPAARARLERCLREHPSFAGSIAPYVAARLSEGASGAAIMVALDDLLGGVSSRARLALAEGLLALRRYREVLAALDGLPEGHADALAVSRVELFARIADGQANGLEDALERARASAMRASEIELFQGWRDVTETGQTERRPSIAATKRLLRMLETLLVAHDFEGFERLFELLSHSPLEERERREALAEMYLRRGFLASAAEEWMGACNVAPDTRALLGLARVALAQGMARESEEFALAALEHDPANEAAVALLAELQPVSG
jgi:tetratricopeptide (TPR) repeat protein